MPTISSAFAATRPVEDPIAHLTCSSVWEYKKEAVIYSPVLPSTNLYMILRGTVKVHCIADDGREVMVDIYHVDEFFGESALLNSRHGLETAVAMEQRTRVMAWTSSLVEELMVARPRLGVALIQMLAQRCIHAGRRIESLASEDMQSRLARTLIYFSERLGRAMEDGSSQLMPLTHELISQYVGTSRELVTRYMNQFRREGYLRYSRKGIVLYPDAIRTSLQ
jgi:CRP/FNR family cyclic AMP-dependent transcriptional regulator